MSRMPRRLVLALLLCGFGIALLDQAIALLREGYLALRPPDLSPAENFGHIRRASRWGRWLEHAGLVVLWLLALRLAFPHGIVRDEYPTLLAFLIAFTLGRSLLGVGEGFATDFLWQTLICGALAVAIHHLLPVRN